jgi:hypothetical protein
VDLSLYLSALNWRMARAAPKYGVCLDTFVAQNSRILLNRGKIVEFAKSAGSTHIFFIDPDHRVDMYYSHSAGPEVKQESEPFFESAFEFLRQHPMAICAAPYAGCPPDLPIHVFAKGENGQMARLSHEQAKGLRGWQSVEAVGSGVMLIGMDVFDRMKQPYFDDVYTDEKNTCLKHSQDVHFCLEARKLGIPIFVNFNCWVGHWQHCLVGKPWEPMVAPEGESASDPDPYTVPELAIAGEGSPTWRGGTQ